MANKKNADNSKPIISQNQRLVKDIFPIIFESVSIEIKKLLTEHFSSDASLDVRQNI